MDLYDHIRSVAFKFYDAIEAENEHDAAECLDDKLLGWHNFDNIIKSKSQIIAIMINMRARIRNIRYTERKIHVFDCGFVQQHVLQGIRRGDNEPVTLHAAVICRVTQGKITHFDEYIDSREVAEFRKI